MPRGGPNIWAVQPVIRLVGDLGPAIEESLLISDLTLQIISFFEGVQSSVASSSVMPDSTGENLAETIGCLAVAM